MGKGKDPKKPPPPPNGGWGISIDKGTNEPTWITNFHIEVVSRVDVYYSSESEPIPHVTLKLSFGPEKYSEEFIEPLSALDKIRWFSKDTKVRLYPNVAEVTAQRHIADYIRERLPSVEPKKQYRLKRLGVHIIEGEAVFCTGGEVIRPPHDGSSNRPFIVPDSIPHTLDYDPDLSEEEATASMIELISLSPDYGRTLLAYNLMCLMWLLYKFAWKAPRFCLYIYGLTASLKTTLSAFISQIYNRGKGIENPPRLNSSIPKAVELIYEKDHCAIILDDLFPSDSSQIQRKQEETLGETSRIIGDGVVPGRVKGCETKKNPPTVGMIFTAEYLLNSAESTAARLLPIEVAPPSHETRQKLVDFINDKPLVVSSFYRNFIHWVISNYDGAQESLKACWNVYSKLDFAAHYGMDVHARLRETHYYLNTAYVMFLQYCSEKGIISEDDAEALRQSFLELLTDLVLEQESRVKQGKLLKPEIKVNYLAYIRKLYMDGKFKHKLAPSAKKFDVKAHDCVIHLGCLCIYGERFREIFDTASVNLDEVLDDIESQGALQLQSRKGNRTIQIYISKEEKRRFYAIKLTHLK